MLMNCLRLSHAYHPMLSRWIAIASDRHLAYGDPDANVLAVEFLASEEGCHKWFERIECERPWEKRIS